MRILSLVFFVLSCSGDKGAVETGGDTQSVSATDADLDGFDETQDCDDTNPEVHPDASEICDEVDNDCDDEIDEEDAVDAETWYLDADSDGYGDALESVIQCTAPSGYVAESKSGFDCDDTRADFHPGADESDCTDPNDYNCDGSVAYEDVDGDGWAACEECDDSDSAVNPDAVEICDELDNDCDALTDDEDDDLDVSTATTWYADADEDGFGNEEESSLQCAAPSGHVEVGAEGFDCDDSDDRFYPGADESDCEDPNDYNCDGSVAYEDVDGDGWAACEDCDDSDDAVHPSATEICNEVDDDCDGVTDDEDLDLSGATTWYIDHDGDGYGSSDYSATACEVPSGYVDDDSDCNDMDTSIHPDGIETCNEVDDDCDGDIDDEDADVTGTSTWYTDGDDDGYGDASDPIEACEAPSGTVEDATDCDDSNEAVSPAGTEVCNEVDDDCDGDTDDDDSDVTGTSTWYIDHDGDGYGSTDYSAASCEAPSGYVEDDTDCSDIDATVHPGATETCNEVDDDCDGAIDDDDADVTGTATWYSDADGDGYGDADSTVESCEVLSGYVEDATDCDDSNEDISPSGTETCNSVDDDCDGAIDDEDADVTGTATWYSDADADGYGDADSTVEACEAPSGTVEDATDCDDGDEAVSPAGIEVCNEVDDDCDGDTDDDDSDVTGTSTWYIDHDGDGYGSTDYSASSCEAPPGYVEDDTDCSDIDATVHPGATETCNDVDDDCDGDTDDADADVTGTATWYSDSDGDGYGDADSTVESCEAPSGTVDDDTDCDDSNDAVSPAGTETCNEVDDDCDGAIDDEDADVTGTSTWYTDADADGYGDADSTVEACEAPSGTVDDATDCDDSDPDRSPGAVEVDGDEVDNNCENDPPSITSLEIAPEDALTDDLLELSVETSDPDGDTVSYTIDWRVDGTSTGTADTQLDGALYFDRDQEVTVQVTPSDGVDEGDAAEASLTISNTPPEAPEISITPEEPTAGIDDLQCVVDVESDDADGDSITYAVTWEVDGVAYTDATSTTEAGDTVPAEDVTASVVWTCAMTPSDGSDDGDLAEATVTPAPGQTTVVYDTADTYEFVVPSGITSLTVKAWGAGGGSPQHGSTGGGGGFASGTLSVSSGEVYVVIVGGGGGGSPTCGSGSAGGSPGGGGSGSNYCAHTGYGNGGGGGGYSGVFYSSETHGNAMILAGGGGGGSTTGGAGGGETGGDAVHNGYNTYGRGGTQSAGGAAGGGGWSGNSGSALQGAAGATISSWGTGGGGGGYYGGGSGGVYCCGHGGGGGGGSGYVSGSDTVNTAGSTYNVANSSDAEYVSPAGQGSTSAKGDGEDGLVVLVYE